MRTFFLSVMMILFTAVASGQTTASVSKGNQYYRSSQFDLAEAEYRRALQEDPDNYTAQYNLASALHRQKKYDEANAILDKLSGTSKENKAKAAAAYNQGVGFTKQKELESSIEAYKKAL